MPDIKKQESTNLSTLNTLREKSLAQAVSKLRTENPNISNEQLADYLRKQQVEEGLITKVLGGSKDSSASNDAAKNADDYWDIYGG